MDLNLGGRVVLVTGASRGIGRAVALEFAREGARISIAARGEEALEAVRSEIEGLGAKVLATAADVTVPEDIEGLITKTVEAFGGIDIVVNNAGRAQPGTFETLSDEEWEQDLRVKLFSQIRVSRAALPYLRKSEFPRIINVNAIVGRVTDRGLIATATNRAACLALTKSLAVELAPERILANSVNIGFVMTPQWENIRRHLAPDSTPDQFRELIAGRVPLGRMGEPEEIAGMVVFLASEWASYITGASIDIGGGYGQHV